MKRKGYILGSRIMGYFLKAGDTYEHYLGPVSAYVKFKKFAKGRRSDPKMNFYME